MKQASQALNAVGRSRLDYKEEVEEVEEGWEEKGWSGGGREGAREVVEVCAKVEQLLQVTFHESARGQIAFFHFYSLSSPVSPYAIVMDPPPKKVSLAATPKICRRAEASLFFVFSHYHPIMCLSSPE